jgi:hypothetical protein
MEHKICSTGQIGQDTWRYIRQDPWRAKMQVQQTL